VELKRVLLVDDSEAVNFLHRKLLRRHVPDCEVWVTINGQEALDRIAQSESCPDVIVLDINMPVMDGFEFLETINQQKLCIGHSKIFIVTSSDRDEDRDKVLGYSFVKGYLQKPLDEKSLTGIINTIGSL
jgi:CheY-like chemotaxis protein